MGSAAFKAAQGFLSAHRTDYRATVEHFRWPQLDHFNWALDWFDAELAQGAFRHDPALQILGDDPEAISFAEMSVRSNQIANGLRHRGVRRGDRILLMLGNVAP